MSSFARRKESDANQARIASQTNALNRWLEAKHPDIPICVATTRAFQEDMGEAFLTATEEDFEYSLTTTSTTFSRNRVPTVAEENARRKALSASELHELARKEHPVPQPDVLPQFYTPIGREREIELTPETLRRAGTRTGEISIADLKHLIRKFGSSEVNKRLGVTPKAQPGYSKAFEI